MGASCSRDKRAKQGDKKTNEQVIKNKRAES
jgi:hypothetical protein